MIQSVGLSHRPPCGQLFLEFHREISVARSKSPHSPIQSITSGVRLSSPHHSESERSGPPIIGILGGIGSGKSSVIRAVTEFCLQIIDADKIGHQLLADVDIQSRLREQFGAEIFSDPETIDRAALARIVFGGDKETTASRQHLNNILHPAIRREIHSQIDSAPANTEAIILDAALLLEGGWDETCHWLIFIDTPKEIREERVRVNRNWSADELARREESQFSISHKKDRANFVVDNSGSIEKAAEQMTKVLVSILHSASDQ